MGGTLPRLAFLRGRVAHRVRGEQPPQAEDGAAELEHDRGLGPWEEEEGAAARARLEVCEDAVRTGGGASVSVMEGTPRDDMGSNRTRAGAVPAVARRHADVMIVNAHAAACSAKTDGSPLSLRPLRRHAQRNNCLRACGAVSHGGWPAEPAPHDAGFSLAELPPRAPEPLRDRGRAKRNLEERLPRWGRSVTDVCLRRQAVPTPHFSAVPRIVARCATVETRQRTQARPKMDSTPKSTASSQSTRLRGTSTDDAHRGPCRAAS